MVHPYRYIHTYNTVRTTYVEESKKITGENGKPVTERQRKLVHARKILYYVGLNVEKLNIFSEPHASALSGIEGERLSLSSH